jgi:hypothetical protein
MTSQINTHEDDPYDSNDNESMISLNITATNSVKQIDI